MTDSIVEIDLLMKEVRTEIRNSEAKLKVAESELFKIERQIEEEQSDNENCRLQTAKISQDAKITQLRNIYIKLMDREMALRADRKILLSHRQSDNEQHDVKEGGNYSLIYFTTIIITITS